MKKRILAIAMIFVMLSFSASGALRKNSKRNYVIGFYNLENLFDTYHDEGKRDDDFLPDGKNKWTETKYNKKIHNMARVIKAMAKDNGAYHTILGVSEVENRHVLEDLVNEPQIADANYQIVHYDGPDRRGVDVALFYKPEQFTLLDSESIPFDFNSTNIEFNMDKEGQEHFKTRDILMARGLIDGEMFAIYVAHLPSRIGGKGQDLRARGAEIIYEHSMKLQNKYPKINIVVMGDMNDDATDPSMTEYLHGRVTIKEVSEVDFFSPFMSMLKAGYGTLAYRGNWNLFDCILVNHNLVNGEDDSLQIMPIVKKKKQKFYGRVFNKPFMVVQKGRFKGQPFRTFSGGAFINGYSDHYPTYIVVAK